MSDSNKGSHFVWNDEDYRTVDAYIYEDGWLPDTNDPLRYIQFWNEFEHWRIERRTCAACGINRETQTPYCEKCWQELQNDGT